jgi:hypothetical protein
MITVGSFHNQKTVGEKSAVRAIWMNVYAYKTKMMILKQTNIISTIIGVRKLVFHEVPTVLSGPISTKYVGIFNKYNV